jgi:GAF domain-containing protein
VFEGDSYVAAALRGVPPAYASYLRDTSFVPGPHTAPYRFLKGERSAIQNIDLASEKAYLTGDPQRRALVDLGGARTALQVPLVRDEVVLGVITVYRQEVKPFSEQHVTLLQSFADQAVIAIQNTRLFNETKEALERQTATADILKVIASSPSDTTPVFEAIATSARRLLPGFRGASVFAFREGNVYVGASTNPVAVEGLKGHFPRPLHQFEPFEMAQLGRPFPIPDTEEAPNVAIKTSARLHGFRSVLYVPLMNGGIPIGVISVTRAEPGTFAPHHVQLLQTFADQAVIAIENARLFNETKEALEHQTASSDVLQVIGKSMADAQPVFERIVDSLERLFDHKDIGIFLTPGDGLLHVAARRGRNAEVIDRLYPQAVEQTTVPAVLEARQQVHYPDVLNGADVPQSLRRVAEGHENFSNVLTPLLWNGRGIGIIAVTREPNVPFSGRELSLLRTFADQAVIAIENARLFEEVQARTRALQESLQQQTATADVLKVISRSAFDLNSVMDTLTSSAAELCKAEVSALYLREGDVLVARGVAHADAAQVDFLRRTPLQIDDSTYIDRASQAGTVRNIADVAAETETGQLKRFGETVGFRSIVFVPLMRESRNVGIFALARGRTGQFSQREVELVQTFADQAVIAIENVRLFNEVQERTVELSEALEQQTATAEVLGVISSCAGDLGPVFDAMLGRAMQLCSANFGVLNTYDGKAFLTEATYGLPPAYDEYRRRQPLEYGPATAPARLLAGEPFVEFTDLPKSEAYRSGEPNRRALVDLGGAQALLAVPLLKDERVVGNVMIFRQENRPFSEKQIALLQQFASQAVIAIENARLLRELHQRTDDLTESLVYQTGSSNILKVIASSPTDVTPALKAIVESAADICDAYDAVVLLKEGGDLRFSAHHGPIPMGREKWPISRRWVTGRAVIDKLTQHVHDVLGREGTHFPEAQEMAHQDGIRTVLSVPLLQEGDAVGAIMLRRIEPRPFNDKQIELLKSFADQAVIAISNVRLFEQVQERTRELSKSLDDLRAAQDRLIQTEKLASLGQLTAGIAHEIKNPLNFVNNFSAVSAELVDEMTDVFQNPALDETGRRKELDEIRELLKSNLEKVVQHGKRADSIVKNMLLHSREGSGELREADINALVEESLNLAYHGARAEKSGFNIILQRELDASAGSAEVFPQEVTRALLNLISNGFYAATKRKTESDEAGFEPNLLATTRNLGASVEIRIRDNGDGIPPEVKEKMFNPFFTTKPAGEGTGLGLSMTHDIIVKQHGGTIRVKTEPGAFTEFIVTLPRASGGQGIQRST